MSREPSFSLRVLQAGWYYAIETQSKVAERNQALREAARTDDTKPLTFRLRDPNEPRR
jgi:hypothetical protein